MANNKVSFTITAETKDASNAITSLQKELGRLSKVKSNNTETQAQLDLFKKINTTLGDILKKEKDQGRNYKKWEDNAKQIDVYSKELINAKQKLAEFTALRNSLQAKKDGGSTLTAAETANLSRYEQTIVYWEKEQSRIQASIAKYKEKNVALDEHAQAALAELVEQYGEIKTDENSILGLTVGTTKETESAAQAARQHADAIQEAVDATNRLSGSNQNSGDTTGAKRTGGGDTTKSTDSVQTVKDAELVIDALRGKIDEVLNFDRANAGIADLVVHLQELVTLENAMKKSNSVKALADGYAKVRESIIVTKADIKAWDNEVKQANASAQQGTGETTSAFERMKATFSTVGSSIKQGFSTVSGVVSKVGTAFQTVQRVVVKVASVMKSAVNGFVKMAKSGFNALVKTIGKIKSAFSSMSRDNQRSFKHMITNITKYVFGFRSLFFLVRRMRKYIGEGIQGMAQFNKGSNPVNANISKLITSLEYLKNAWSTAFDPILQFVTPWLTALIDKLADAGNAFSRFLGDLLGTGEVFQAVKGPTKNYAKSLDKAGKSAGGAAKKQKQLNDRLADFDDLHVLGKDNDNKGSGGGSGSGGNDDDKKRNNKLWDFAKVGKDLQNALKNMTASADFTALGKKISEGLSKALDSIPWANIKIKAYKIGKSIATFLNGALGDKKLWESAGTALGDGVNTLMELLKGFLENNKVDFGGNFANLINKLFETVDWNTVKENIKSFVDTLITNINSFLTTLDKSKIGEGVTTLSEGITYFISHAISDIKWGELWGLLASVGGSIIDGIVAGFSQSDNPFLKAISGLLGSVKKAFEEGDATVAASGLTTFFKKVFANIKFEDIFNDLKAFFDKLFSDIFSTLSVDNGNGFGQLFQSLGMVAQTIGNIFSAIINLLPQIMPSILQVTDASMNLFNALLPIITTILPVIGNLVGYVTQIISSVLVPVLQILTPIIQFICDIINLIMPIFADIVDLINEVFGSLTVIIEPLTSLLKELLTPISAILQPIMSILKIVFKLVGDILSPIMELLAPLMEILTELLKPIFQVLTVIGDIIGAIFVPILQVVANIIRAIIIPIINALIAVFRVVAGVLQNVGEVFGALFNAIRETLEDVKKTMVKVVNWIADKIEWLVNAIIGGINAAIGLINKVHIKVPDGIPIIGGKEFGFKIKELKTISIPRLAQGAVIPPNNEFLAMLGDQSHGTNIEAPLDTIKQAVAEVLATNGNQEVIQLLQQLIAVVESKNLVIGDRAIGQANARYTNQQRIIRGTSF